MSDGVVNEKFQQLCLHIYYSGTSTMNTFNRCVYGIKANKYIKESHMNGI